MHIDILIDEILPSANARMQFAALEDNAPVILAGLLANERPKAWFPANFPFL
jgi:hypothetical protein